MCAPSLERMRSPAAAGLLEPQIGSRMPSASSRSCKRANRARTRRGSAAVRRDARTRLRVAPHVRGSHEGDGAGREGGLPRAASQCRPGSTRRAAVHEHRRIWRARTRRALQPCGSWGCIARASHACASADHGSGFEVERDVAEKLNLEVVRDRSAIPTRRSTACGIPWRITVSIIGSALDAASVHAHDAGTACASEQVGG